VETVDFLPAGNESGGDEDRTDDGAGARTLLDLAEAARDRRPVTFGYTARHGRVTQRTVEPHGVVAHRGLLYLVGFDLARSAARTFRVDRIDRLRVLEGTFAVAVPVARTDAGPDPACPDSSSAQITARASSSLSISGGIRECRANRYPP
jgi:predicted DNA-binding transcriptional regulator YafY